MEIQTPAFFYSNSTNMKKAILLIVTIFLVYVVAIVVVIHAAKYSTFGTNISKQTNDKYLRNIKKMHPISNRELCPDYHIDDSVSFAATIPCSMIDPFNKWYIFNVGVVPRNSELSRKLDSIAATYVETNPYK